MTLFPTFFALVGLGAALGVPCTVDETGAPNCVIWVDDDYSGTESGTEAQPYNTIEEARDALTSVSRESGWDGAWIVLKSGTYRLSSTIVLDANDSGTSSGRVTYKAAPSATVVITGGVEKTFTEVTSADSWAWARMPEAGRGYVYKTTGVTGNTMYEQASNTRLIVGGDTKYVSVYPYQADDRHYDGWISMTAQEKSEDLGTVANEAGMVAKTGAKWGDWVYRTDTGTDWRLVGSDPTNAANWSNQGWAGIYYHGGRYVYDIHDSAIANWDVSTQAVYFQGVFESPSYINWSRLNTVSLNGGYTRVQDNVYYGSGTPEAYQAYTPYGAQSYMTVKGSQRFGRLRNAIEGLTSDRYVYVPSTGTVYYWSPSGAPANAEMTSVTTLFTVENASHIRFEGLEFRGVKSDLFLADEYGVDDLSFVDCTMDGYGREAINFVNSTNVVVDGCTIRDGPSTAIRLHGGNWLTLTDSGNQIINSTIEDIGNEMRAEIVLAISMGLGQWHYEPSIPSYPNSYGFLIDNCTFQRLGDALAGAGGGVATNGGMTVTDNKIIDVARYTSDSGTVGNAAKYYIPHSLFARNLIERARKMPRQSNFVYVMYWDGLNEWTAEDNTFYDCEIAFSIVGINLTIRRNLFIDCDGNPSWAEGICIIPNRDWYMSQYWPPEHWGDVQFYYCQDLADEHTPTYDYLYEYLPDELTGEGDGAAWEVRWRPRWLVFVDNLYRDGPQSKSGDYLGRWGSSYDYGPVNGVYVGVDATQLNYPFDAAGSVNTLCPPYTGFSGTWTGPVAGGGSVQLSTISKVTAGVWP